MNVNSAPSQILSGADSEDWKYSSARNFQEDDTVLAIDNIGFLISEI
ncbi:hypothetical protein [Tenacibaculum jejuense]|uniref:Uncharacterized protein n=1 Tax=Tenacibaculum jejuense TaxID=584609 RepID=A0A238UEJ4_9FLAO|nr:hypothetical protein [Tenacibaculum jejuense]SNR17627.1 protein of unknown function [Tenacibaculum jejuense]